MADSSHQPDDGYLWDFQKTFPSPLPDAVQSGILAEIDLSPESIRAIHDEHARDLLATLEDMDALAEAQRKGLDPSTWTVPRTEVTKERTAKFITAEIQRLQEWWEGQMTCYEDAFGGQAREAFERTIREWHRGIDAAQEEKQATPKTPPSPPQQPASNEQLTFGWEAPPQAARPNAISTGTCMSPAPSSRSLGAHSSKDGFTRSKGPERLLRDAVERYLRERNIPYVSVDEAKKALFVKARLSSFHFVSYGKKECNWLIWAAAVRKGTIDDMREWEKVFGEEFRAVLTRKDAMGQLSFRTLDGATAEIA